MATTVKQFEIVRLSFGGKTINLLNLGDGEFSSTFESDFFKEIKVDATIEVTIMHHFDEMYSFNPFDWNVSFYAHINHQEGDNLVVKINDKFYEFYIS
jgi:hypothetical protein